jgi:hypothetical protein
LREMNAGDDVKERKMYNEYWETSPVFESAMSCSEVQVLDNSLLARAIMMTEADYKINKIPQSYMPTKLVINHVACANREML